MLVDWVQFAPPAPLTAAMRLYSRSRARPRTTRRRSTSWSPTCAVPASRSRSRARTLRDLFSVGPDPRGHRAQRHRLVLRGPDELLLPRLPRPGPRPGAPGGRASPRARGAAHDEGCCMMRKPTAEVDRPHRRSPPPAGQCGRRSAPAPARSLPPPHAGPAARGADGGPARPRPHVRRRRARAHARTRRRRGAAARARLHRPPGWALAIEELSKTHRVIALDQRWHGRGIRSPRFRFSDCADDVVALMDELGVERAIVAGYSMGGAIAQLVWHQHPERVAGLVLCSTARNFRGLKREKFFFPVLTGVTQPSPATRWPGSSSSPRPCPRCRRWTAPTRPRGARRSSAAPAPGPSPRCSASSGRFNSAAWIGEVDVPTAVVVTEKDHTIPAAPAAQAGRLDRGRHASTSRPAATPRSCCGPAPGCRCSARRSPTSPGGPTSRRARTTTRSRRC